MMNTIVLICLTLLSVFGLRAQNGGEEMVKNTIDSFFLAFHQQDSVALRESVSKDIVLQTIGKTYNIQIDGPMANAWTNYEFWVNDSFSHCGVNSFQLFNDQGSWKIIYLIDTRRKEGCD